MRSLTVTIPDEARKAARVYAARHNTTATALVTDFLYTLHHLASSNNNLSPAEAIQFHCRLLRAGKVGRVNFEPFNIREIAAALRFHMENKR